MTTDEWYSSFSGWTREHTVHFLDDEGQSSQKYFRDYGDAFDFLSDQKASAAPTRSAGTSNRALLNRIAGRSPPNNPPRSLAGVLLRVSGTMLTRER